MNRKAKTTKNEAYIAPVAVFAMIIISFISGEDVNLGIEVAVVQIAKVTFWEGVLD